MFFVSWSGAVLPLLCEPPSFSFLFFSSLRFTFPFCFFFLSVRGLMYNKERRECSLSFPPRRLLRSRVEHLLLFFFCPLLLLLLSFYEEGSSFPLDCSYTSKNILSYSFATRILLSTFSTRGCSSLLCFYAFYLPRADIFFSTLFRVNNTFSFFYTKIFLFFVSDG